MISSFMCTVFIALHTLVSDHSRVIPIHYNTWFLDVVGIMSTTCLYSLVILYAPFPINHFEITTSPVVQNYLLGLHSPALILFQHPNTPPALRFSLWLNFVLSLQSSFAPTTRIRNGRFLLRYPISSLVAATWFYDYYMFVWISLPERTHQPLVFPPPPRTQLSDRSWDLPVLELNR